MSANSDRRLHLLVAGVVGAGVFALGVGFLDPVFPGQPPAGWKIALAIVAFCVGDVAAIHLRFGHDQHSFTLSETAVVLGLALLPSPWARFIAVLCVGAAHLAARRPLVKVLFNAFGFAAGMALARVGYNVVFGQVGHLGDVGHWAALAAGAFAFFVWNGITVSAAVAVSQGLRVRVVYFKGLMLNSVVFLGNTALGIGMIAAATTRRDLVLVLPICVPLLFLCYRGYLRALEERDTWELLQDASREFIGVNQNDVARVVLEKALPLFKAEFVDLLLVREEGLATAWRMQAGQSPEVVDGSAYDLAPTYWPRVRDRGDVFEMRADSDVPRQRADLEGMGLAMCVVAPLPGQGGCLGALRIGFRGNVRMSFREERVLSTFANQVSISIQNARLFEETNEERGKLAGILSHSSDGIFSLDDEGRVCSWNPAMASLTGRHAEAIVGLLVSAIDAQDDNGDPVTPSWLLRRLQHGSFQALVRVAAAGCDRKWLALSVSSIPGSAAEGTARAVVVARDVTSIREAEEAKQDFVATVSHELRTPLTPLKGFLLTLLRPGFEPAPEALGEFHSRMLSQVERLERLIEDLLSISQMERGTFSISAVDTSLDDVVDRVIANVRRPVAFQRGGAEVKAVADPGRVEQVLSNLISNADKYSPPTSAIRVAVEPAGGEIVVTVSDEGPGIPEDQQEVIFERFRRLGHHLTRPTSGTGLGLFIARRLVDAMGGRIWVESRVGEGAHFRFTLPAVGTTPGGAGALYADGESEADAVPALIG